MIEIIFPLHVLVVAFVCYKGTSAQFEESAHRIYADEYNRFIGSFTDIYK